MKSIDRKMHQTRTKTERVYVDTFPQCITKNCSNPPRYFVRVPVETDEEGEIYGYAFWCEGHKILFESWFGKADGEVDPNSIRYEGKPH